MNPIRFVSKAETLLALAGRIDSAAVPNLVLFTVAEWKSDSSAVLSCIQSAFLSLTVVRSSVLGEDSHESSHAGEYRSVCGVDASNPSALTAAIEEVISSFEPDDPDNQFFVQEFVANVSISGVIVSRDLDTGAPYYIINYDDLTGSTDTVTSGKGRELKTYVHYRNAPQDPYDIRLSKVIATCRELEVLCGCDALDIEFAVDHQGDVQLLQVRPIAARGGRVPILSQQLFDSYLLKIHRKIQKFNAPHPGLFGDKAIYSVMTDWNPAEIIGVKPRMLSLSLYKELVTDATWAYQRHNYGYRDLRSFPLVVSFMGLPYVDVRASLNSFVPGTLSEELSHKLVDYYIDRLLQTPTNHDKVEFNIVFSCYHLNLPSRLSELKNAGFSDLEVDRVKFALLKLTNDIVSPASTRLSGDLKRIEHLSSRLATIQASDLPPIDKIYWLTEDCKRYGTLPFAGLARAGFIAVQFLHSFVDAGIISAADLDSYMASLSTITRRLSRDTRLLREGILSQEQFLAEYGHLRPGTYDLLSPRYDESFESYFGGLGGSEEPTACGEEQHFEFSRGQQEKISLALESNGILATAEGILTFIKTAIEGREYSKFVFTRNISEVLRMLGGLGERLEISKNEMAHLNIRTVLDLYSGVTHLDLPEIFKADIAKNKELHAVTEMVRLPQLITNESDVYAFHLSAVEPNYVTLGRVTGVLVVEEEFPVMELAGKIVFIQSADPGYDWIFSKNISGLVTMYGGANSHMAIRCAELKIPAVIGCGETSFDEWKRAKVLDIDCANKKVLLVE